MADKTYNVLFLCTHNSARSILAEGLMNHAGAAGRIQGVLRGQPSGGRVNPVRAARPSRELGVPTDGFRSKSWDEFAGAGRAADATS